MDDKDAQTSPAFCATRTRRGNQTESAGERRGADDRPNSKFNPWREINSTFYTIAVCIFLRFSPNVL